MFLFTKIYLKRACLIFVQEVKYTFRAGKIAPSCSETWTSRSLTHDCLRELRRWCSQRCQSICIALMWIWSSQAEISNKAWEAWKLIFLCSVLLVHSIVLSHSYWFWDDDTIPYWQTAGSSADVAHGPDVMAPASCIFKKALKLLASASGPAAGDGSRYSCFPTAAPGKGYGLGTHPPTSAT